MHTPPHDQHITFTIPTTEWISSNDRYTHHPQARKTALLRQRARHTTHQALTTNQLTHHTTVPILDIMIGYPTNAKADPPNAYPTVKALIDGCTDAGLWDDDNHTIIHAHLFHRDPHNSPKGTHTITLTLTTQPNQPTN